MNARASYQKTDNIRLGHREPFACPLYRNKLNEISNEAIRASQATTQAAYLLRLNAVRTLLKSLG